MRSSEPLRKPRARLAAGVILVLVMACGLGLSVAAATAARGPGSGERGVGELLDGTVEAGWQAAWEAALPVRDAAIAAWTLVRYRLFGEARPEVLVGSDGWLYSAEEFAPPAPLSVPLGRAVDRISAAREALAAKGIDLVVALVPAKAVVESTHLGRYRLPAALDGRYDAARRALADRGITAPDLRAALSQAAVTDDMYLRTDTHWTPAGARAAAAALAGVIVPLLEQHDSSRVAFSTEDSEPHSYPGDLLKFLPLGPWQGKGPVPDTVQVPRSVQDGQGGNDLFGDLDIPVALVGTSYSANPTSGFEPALKDVLDADVLNVAQEGKGPFAPMDAYLASSAIDDPRPDVLLWEIPERYLVP
jgi:alginate O-acetyltransferase complex protein AlgJ